MLVHCHLFITLLRVGTFRWFSGPPCQEQTCRHQWVTRAVGARLVEASFTHADSHSRSGAVRGIRGCVGRVRVLFLGCGRSANKRFLWDKWSIDINSWMMWKAKGIDTPTAVFFFAPYVDFFQETSPLPENWDLYKQFKSSNFADLTNEKRVGCSNRRYPVVNCYISC